jgi:single-stranded DNA-binding protein
MTAYALVTGTLFRAPEQRTSKNGKPFVTATLVAKEGEVTQWWRVTAFSDNAQAEILRLSEGEALSVQGPMKVEEYEKDGQKRVSLGVIAGHVLALAQPPKPRGRDERGPAHHCGEFDAGDALR